MQATNISVAATTNRAQPPDWTDWAVPQPRVWRWAMAAVRTAVTLFPVLLLTSCAVAPDGDQSPVEQQSVPASSGPLTDDGPLKDASQLELDSAHSWLTIKVYRKGPLAKLGHNHVIRAPMHGFIMMPPAGNRLSGQSRSAAARTVPISPTSPPLNGISGRVWIDVKAMLIDEPAARAAAGSDFSSLPTSRDIEGTGANMRSKALLNAAAFPRISADFSWPDAMQRMPAANGDKQSATHAAADSSEGPCTPIQIAVTVAGRRTALQVCADTAIDRSNLTGRAQFTLRQTDLGLTPFAVFGGALRVADEMQIAVDIATLRPSGT